MTHDRHATTVRSRRCWYLAGASCLAGALALVAPFLVMMLIACGGWLLAAVALSEGVGTLRGIRGPTHGETRNVKSAWLAVAICAVLLGVQTIFCFRALAVTRHITEGAVSRSNLKGIDLAIREYVKRSGAYPGRFEDLVTANGMVAPKQFVSPFDNAAPSGHLPDQLEYSSYVYTPVPGDRGDEASIVLAYEREPWFLTGTWMFAGYGRWVLFGDGHTQLLDNTAFAVALTNDNARRRELGWPTDLVYTPSTHPASQRASTHTAPATASTALPAE